MIKFFQKLQNEVEGIEDLFKSVSKKFQAMIQDLSRDEVDRIMNTLKKEKGKQLFSYLHDCLVLKKVVFGKEHRICSK
jgi:hypothetical protein